MQIDGKKTQTTGRCMQVNSRTYETMKSRDKVASGTRKTHNMTSQQWQAQFGNQWNVVQTTAGESNTMPTRQHLELGQASSPRPTRASRRPSDRSSGVVERDLHPRYPPTSGWRRQFTATARYLSNPARSVQPFLMLLRRTCFATPDRGCLRIPSALPSCKT